MPNDVKSCKKIDEKAQTSKFTVHSRVLKTCKNPGGNQNSPKQPKSTKKLKTVKIAQNSQNQLKSSKQSKIAKNGQNADLTLSPDRVAHI